MALMNFLNPIGTAINTGLSLASRGAALQELNKSTQPGYLPGTIKPGDNIDFSELGNFYTDSPGSAQQAQRQGDFHTAAERIPMLQEQFQQQAAMKDKYLPQFQQNIDQYKNGALGAANRKVTDLINGGAEAISQDTMNAMVSQFMDRNRQAAASQSANAERGIAARGLTGGNAASLRQQVSTSEREQNANDYRDTAIQRELANKQYGLQLNSLGAQVGGAYSGGLDELLRGQASFDQSTNPDFQMIGQLLAAQQTAQDQQRQDALLGVSGQFQQYGNSFWDAMNADRAYKQQMAIAQANKPSILGPLVGAAGSVGGGVASGLLRG